MPEMPRKAARDGLPGGPGGAWAAVLRRGADQVRGRGWAWGHGWAGRGAAQSPYTVTHGGNCTNRAATRRRHAVKQLLMLQNPPITRQEGTTRTEQPGHDAWERLQQPPRQLNHHERNLGSAAPPAAPASDVPTCRVTGPQRSWLSGCRPRAAHPRATSPLPGRHHHRPPVRCQAASPPPGDNTSGEETSIRIP